MENISASSHASIKSAWSFVDAVDVVVLQEDSELIRSAYMHGLILDPVIAQSKTLGGGSDYSDEFVSKCLKIWASMKSRRFKQSGKVAKRDDNKRFRIGTVDNDDSTSEVESESNIQRMQRRSKTDACLKIKSLLELSDVSDEET